MKQPLISVIIPVYNVEKYLARCVESILRQTYQNLEIWLIDDGSTDGSGKICDKYTQKEARIRTLHKTHGGVSSARNMGLEHATGDYISFVDADDYIESSMYEQLLSALINNKADISMCGVANVWQTGKRNEAGHRYPAEKLYTNFREWMEDFSIYGMYGISCNKLFKKQMIGNTRFDTRLKRAEDVRFVFEVTKNDRKIIVIPQPLYCYFQRNRSSVRQLKISYLASEYRVWKEIFDELTHQKTERSAFVERFYYRNLAPRAARLAILIMLYDEKRQYNNYLLELHNLFLERGADRTQMADTLAAVFVPLLAKHPNLTVWLLRLPGIKQAVRLYIQYKKGRE